MSPTRAPDPATPASATESEDVAIPATGDALDSLTFDAALAELQSVVSRLEQGGLPLEESIALYERGVALHDRCARLLTDAEMRVRKLVESAGGALRAIDLTPEDAEEA